MGSHLILVIGLVLGTCLPIEAQMSATQIVRTQISPGLTTNRTSELGFPLIIVPVRLFRGPLRRPAFHFSAAYEPEPTLGSRLPIEETRTPFLRESSLSVAHFGRGLQLDVADSTLQVGPPKSGSGFQNFAPSSHDQAGVVSSVKLDGIGLRYTFGRPADTGKRNQIWRCVLWVTGRGHDCPL